MEETKCLLCWNVIDKLAQQSEEVSKREEEASREAGRTKRERDFQDAFMKTLMICAGFSYDDAKDFIRQCSDDELVELDDDMAKRHIMPLKTLLIDPLYGYGYRFDGVAVLLVMVFGLGPWLGFALVTADEIAWLFLMLMLKLVLVPWGVYVLWSLRPWTKNSVRQELRQKYGTSYADVLRNAPKTYIDRLPYDG